MNLHRLGLEIRPTRPSGKTHTVLAATCLILCGLANAQTLQIGPITHLNRNCLSCNALGVDLFSDPRGTVFADWIYSGADESRTRNTDIAVFAPATGQWGPSSIGKPANTRDVNVQYDGRGGAVAVWDEFFEGTSSVYFSSYSGATGTWAPRTFVYEDYYYSGTEVDVAANGNALLAVVARGDQPILHFDATTRTLREVDYGTLSSETTFAADGNAFQLMVGRAWSSSVDQLVTVRRFDGATRRYGPWVQLNPKREFYYSLDTDYPSIKADRYGNAMAMWSYREETYDELEGPRLVAPVQMASARYLSRTGQWISKPIPRTNTGDVYPATMVTDASANVYAVWAQNMSGVPNVVFAKYSAATGKWSTPRRIQSGTRAAWGPKIATDGKGNIVAAWFQKNNAGKFVQTAARYSITSASWGTPITVQVNGSVNSYGTRLVMDSSGAATIAWLQATSATDSSHRVYAARVFCKTP